MWSAAKFYFFSFFLFCFQWGLILVCWLLDRLHSIAHQSITKAMPPSSFSKPICQLWAQCAEPSAPITMGQSNGWRLTIANYAKWDWLRSYTLSLSPHSRHSPNELQQHTEGHPVGVNRCLFTRHAIHFTSSDDGSSITVMACSQSVRELFTNLDCLEGNSELAARCKLQRYCTQGAFLFLHDVWRQLQHLTI